MSASPQEPHALARACVETMYANDAASQALGMRILGVGPGRARVAMQVRHDMVNGHRTCHGGFIFSLADSAFAFACNTYDAVTVAAGASIEFLAPARLGDELIAIAEEQTRSRRTGVYDVTVVNQGGERIALFRGRSHQLDGRVLERR